MVEYARDFLLAAFSTTDPAAMRDATGIALSVGAQLLAAKRLTVEQGGVYGPEGCLDPDGFLHMVGKSGIYAYSDLALRGKVSTEPFPIQIQLMIIGSKYLIIERYFPK
jgi:hypothetical protein